MNGIRVALLLVIVAALLIVEGAPEPWEADAIFSERDLEREIELTREYPASEQRIEELERELRTVWTERRLAADAVLPNIRGRDAAEAVAIAYALPGWDARR